MNEIHAASHPHSDERPLLTAFDKMRTHTHPPAARYSAYLEKEVEAQKARRLDAMKALRKQSETITELIREKEIDRVKLSHAVGAISMITWRELNV